MQSELVAVGSINGVMNGKHYNRTIPTHKVMFEALTRLLFDIYMQSLPVESRSKCYFLFVRIFHLF